MAAQNISQSATTQQKPRLMIKEIVLHNFKSYAGEQRVGPFHKLRLNKVSELIHNSANHPNLDEARVSVHFQEIIDTEGEGFEVVPGSELVIARTAHSNNSSNYYVNGRKSSFSDVTALLKAKGVDLDNNRFLILQGEVEQISMMKPKAQQPNETGLLEYLEDIIGTDQYVEPIEEHYKRLEEVSEARQGMVARVKVVERERDALEDDKLLAESYLSKQREMHAHKAMAAQMHMRAGQENIETIDSSVAKLSEKLQYEQNKARDANDALERAEAAFNEITEEHSALIKQLQAAKKEFKGYENKDAELRVTIKAKKDEIAKLQAKATAADTKRADTETELEKLHKDIPRIERRMTDMAAALQEAEQDVAHLAEGCKEETERLVTSLQAVRTKLAPWDARAADVQSKLDVAAAERDALVKDHEAAKAQLKAAQEALAAAEQAAVDKAADIRSMEKQLKATRKAMESAATDEKAAEEALAALEASVGELRGRVEQRRADRSSAANQGRVVAGLMDAKRKGALKGIHGRLGDLGAVDAKYDVAASTAISALDYIVVDSTADAQTAVEHLRRNNLGVATFLILDKQQHLATAAAKSAMPPEGVARLFDLVKCDNPRLRVAFYYAMRDTVVANDLDQAARIAYGGDGRWRRVVTLKGEMINESGTMTGGGGKPRGGRICLGKAAPKTVDGAELEAALAADEQTLGQQLEALAEARAQCKQAAAGAREAARSIASLETQIAKAALAVEDAQATAEDLRTRLDGLKAQTRMDDADATRLEQLEAEVAALRKELETIERGAAGLRTEAAELQEGIDNAGGQPLRDAKARVTAIEQGTADAEAELQRKRVSIKTADKALVKLAKDAAKARAEAEEVAVKLQEDRQHSKQMEDAAFELMTGIKATEAKLQAMEQAVEEVRATHDAKMKEASVIRKVEATIAAELSNLKASRDKEGAAVKHADKQLREEVVKLQHAGAQDPESMLLTSEQLAAIKDLTAETAECIYQATILEEELGKMNVNLGTIEAYMAKESEFQGRLRELEAVTAQRDEVKQAYESLRKRRLDEFMAGFHTISLKLKEMYQMITLGGDAELELVDSLDPFTEGIVFSVRPPKKSWKNISNLSGGEKTLSSLSLVFALHHYKPTPLYFMDEIDAALDFKNVSIVAHYIVEKTQGAQFIVISLRNNMFELADRLVGIYKTDNCTKSVAINPRSFVVGAPSQEGPARTMADENRPLNAITA